MKCQQCEKSATFHITELTDNTVQEFHLCEDHAREYLSPVEEPAAGGLPALADVLSQQPVGHEAQEELKRLDRQACPVCGITFLEFRKQGRLGCPHDYVAFVKELTPLLINIHGETAHTGKVPRRCATGTLEQTRLIRLRREMKEAVEAEQYEKASQIRDEIRRLEKALPAGDPSQSSI